MAWDPAKIAEDARYDGKWVLRTNTLPPSEVACAYKGLWQVGCRFFGPQLGETDEPGHLEPPGELRPSYHPACRQAGGRKLGSAGAVMVCFLAFVVQQLLTQRLAKIGWQGSFTELLAALGRVRVSARRGTGGQTFRLRDAIPAQAMPALHAVGMRAPRRLERLD